MDEKKAKKELAVGKITCYAVIPDTFLDSVMYGYNDTQITIVTGNGQKNFIDQIITELSEIISVYINHAQTTAFSVEKMIIEQHRMDEYSKLMKDINFSYVDFVLSRNDFAIIEKKTEKKDVIFSLYYLCSLVLFLLMHISIITGSFFSKRNPSSRFFYKSKGIPVWIQLICEFFGYSFIFFVCSILILISFYFVCKSKTVNIFLPLIDNTIELKFLTLFFKLIPLFMMICILQFVSFEFISDISNGILFQFLLILFLCFFGGCFYPLSFFSKPIEIIGNFSPIGNCLTYLINSVTNKEFSLQMTVCFLYSAFFVLLLFFKRNSYEK